MNESKKNEKSKIERGKGKESSYELTRDMDGCWWSEGSTEMRSEVERREIGFCFPYTLYISPYTLYISP